jgi:hypothetical protein
VEKDLVDRGMGPREGLACQAGQVSEESANSSSEASCPVRGASPASGPHSTELHECGSPSTGSGSKLPCHEAQGDDPDSRPAIRRR